MSPEVVPAPAAEDKATLALQDKLDRLLAKAKPTKRELTQQYFRVLYPKLEVYLANGRLLKEVLAAFNELVQAKVCARTFNEMLEQERGRRDEAGNSICCVTCNRPMKPTGQCHAPHLLVGSLSDSANALPSSPE